MSSSVKIKKMNVALVMKGEDLRRKTLLDCLRPSITLEGPDGRTKHIVMTNWRVDSVRNGRHTKYFFKLKKACRDLSGASESAADDMAKKIWKAIKSEIYGTARRKSVVNRFQAAYRKQMRTTLLDEVQKSLSALSKKSVARFIRPKDLATVWKRLQDEKNVENIMAM